jgi:hypothetical protein
MNFGNHILVQYSIQYGISMLSLGGNCQQFKRFSGDDNDEKKCEAYDKNKHLDYYKNVHSNVLTAELSQLT